MNALSRECFQEQRNTRIHDSVVSECLDQLSQWGINNIEQYSKQSWKREMKLKMKKKNFQDLLQWSKKYKKVDTEMYSNKSHEMGSYLKNLNLNDSRVIFRKNCYMLQTVRLNYKSNTRYKAEGYLCPDCLSLNPPVSHPDHQDELLTCQGNSDIRLKWDLSDQKQEAAFYRECIARRIQKYGG